MMSDLKPPDNVPMDSGSETERRIQELADEYLSRLQAGEAVDRTSYIAAHPDIAEPLDRRLALVDRLFHAVRSESDATTQQLPAGDDPNVAPTQKVGAGGSPLEQQHARRLNCPHCGNPIQLVQLAVDEVTCRNCGSTFNVELDRTRTFRPVAPPKQIGRFRVLELVGQGGFGSVFKAYDPDLSRTVAIKVPRTGFFDDLEAEERFLREARHAASLRHPNIVQVHEIARERNIPFIVSDFVDGMTLADLLTANTLSLRDCIELIAVIADALHFAHEQRVVHRDIKPSNILIDRARQPLLTDFGLARRDEGEITVTVDGQILGTPAYMSPEQALGKHQAIDARTDVYSLGVILYRMLTRELPFQGSKRVLLHQVLYDEPRPLRSLNARVPRDLETICLKAMAKEPDRRYTTAREFGDDLRRWLNGEPIHARPVSPVERFWRWSRRNPTVAGLTAAVAALLVLIAAGSLIAAIRQTDLRIAADQAKDEANDQRTRAELNARESHRRLVQFHRSHGVREMQSGDLLNSLVWFATALRLGSGDEQLQWAERVRIHAILDYCPKLVQAWFHDGALEHVEFSPDGRRVLSASRDGTARIWDAATGEPVSDPLVHGDAVLHASFSPDGRKVATASADNTARIWDADTGRSIGLPLQHAYWVRYVTFSPDGELVATASSDNTARIWNAMTGEPASPPLQHAARVNSVSFSPDGRRVVTSTARQATANEAQVWEVASGDRVGQPLVHRDWVWTANFHPDGKRVLTASRDGTAGMWDSETSELLFSVSHAEAITVARFSSDGSRFATAGEAGRVRVWNAETGEPVGASLKHNDIVYDVAFSSDGQYLAAACRDGSAQVWSLATGGPSVPPMKHSQAVFRVRFDADGRHLVTASQDGSMRMWSMTRREIKTFQHRGGVRAVAYRNDGKYVATGGEDNIVLVHDIQTGAQIAEFEHGDAIMHLSFSPDGKLIAAACWDGTAHVWDVQSRRRTIDPLQHAEGVLNAWFHRDGKVLLTASADSTARLWNLANGNLVATMKHESRVNHAVFSPNGQLIATASEDGTARVWDAASGEPITDSLRHESAVKQIGFSQDSTRVATASLDKTARVWDARSGELMRSIEHPTSVMRAIFSREADRLLTSSGDSAHVWDLATGRRTIPTLVHSAQTVFDVAFDPRGRSVIVASGGVVSDDSAGATGLVHVWDVMTGEPLTPPLYHSGRVSRVVVRPDGKQVVTASADNTAKLWNLDADVRPAEDLEQLARLLAARNIDSFGSIVALSPAEQREAWISLRAKYPQSFARSAKYELRQSFVAAPGRASTGAPSVSLTLRP